MDIKEHLTALEKVAKNYAESIDALASTFIRENDQDRLYNADIQARRANERKAEYSGKIEAAATEARNRATPHIMALREAAQDFITGDSDVTLLQQLVAIRSTGVTLTAREIEAFKRKCTGDYVCTRVLGEITGNSTDFSKLEQFDNDVNSLTDLFANIDWYRGPNGELCNLAPASASWSKETAAGSSIFKGRLANISTTLANIKETWEGHFV